MLSGYREVMSRKLKSCSLISLERTQVGLNTWILDFQLREPHLHRWKTSTASLNARIVVPADDDMAGMNPLISRCSRALARRFDIAISGRQICVARAATIGRDLQRHLNGAGAIKRHGITGCELHCSPVRRCRPVGTL